MTDFRLAAGELDRRIRIERDGAPVHDGLQNVPGPPDVIATVWARYRPAPGSERLSSAENASTAPARFLICWQRSLAGLGPDVRIRFPATDDGALYDVKSVVEMGRRVALEFVAVRRVG